MSRGRAGDPGVRVIASPPMPLRARSLRRPRLTTPAIALAIAALVAAGCGLVSNSPPAATPADFGGVASDLGRRGIIVSGVVSGDPGCADQTLARTAIRFRASGLDQSTPVTVYLYSFADRKAFDRLRSAIDQCARSYVTDAATFASIDASPFVLAGQGPWAPTFATSLRDGLLEAATTGG